MIRYKITVFRNRYETEGIPSERSIEEFYTQFKNHVKRTKDKYDEYIASDKLTQTVIKDVGGFIGGETQGNQRKNNVKIIRHLLTLDIDADKPNVYEYLERHIDFCCLIHTTHKHSPEKNRFRIIAPLSRPVNEDEYEAIGRRIAYNIENSKEEVFQGLFDETTFQANRLMFFPTVSADGEYICELLNYNMAGDEQDVIDVDKMLSEYLDHNDIHEWFKPKKNSVEQSNKESKTNKNPLKAKGYVGAFNRSFSITEAIQRFLSHIYKEENNGRYTFIGGTSYGGGIVLNDDTLFYSHHGTDPANLYYRSAFDLVRIHLFGDFDIGYTPEKEMEKDVLEKTDSFRQMLDLCKTLPEVIMQTENHVALLQKVDQQNNFISKNFATDEETGEIIATQEVKEDNGWLVRLANEKSLFSQLDLIFSNDENLGNLFYFDTFRENICFQRTPYWRKEDAVGMPLADKDMSHIRGTLEKVFNIKAEKVVEDAVVIEADKIQVNKVKEYFESLEWDEKPRLEFFFYDFFKVPLNPFTRVALKHWLVGAVSRIYKAGSPMDLVLVLKGRQGIGKSLFFKRLATLDFSKFDEHLYSDTKIDFQKSKDSYEQLEGIWIYEWKELAGMNMSDQESIKAFVDKTEDKFRRSYGRRNVEIKRRVAFGGTTNEKTPLRDRSGNRRFLVLDIPLKQYECYIADTTHGFDQRYKDQLLAEAIHLYKTGYSIFDWTKEEYDWWENSNEDNLAENDFAGSISNYLTMKKPKSWYSMSEVEMLRYLDTYDFQLNKSNSLFYEDEDLEDTSKTCVRELWRIALRQKDVTINRFHRDLLLQALENIGWEEQKTKERFGVFGHQISFRKGSKYDDDLPF